jgi:hypothetical protein
MLISWRIKMEKEFEKLIKTLNKFEGLKLIDNSTDNSWIHFKLDNENSLAAISAQVTDVKEYYPCNLLVLANKNDPNDFSYQLVIEGDAKKNAIKILIKKLENVLATNGDIKKAKQKELGLPDLSLITIRQMAAELKQRNGLTFALVWIENAERDNIAIEGSGNPTQLVGLLTRGSHMAIEWADKNIKFFKPRDDE